MGISPRLVLTALVSATLATLLAIVVNVATSESVPPPFGMVKPYAVPTMVGLWLLTAALMVVQESPRRQVERLKQLLAEPEQLSSAVAAIRGRLGLDLRQRLQERRLFPGLAGLPHVWSSIDSGSDGTRRRRDRLATSAEGTNVPSGFVETFDAVGSGRLVVCGPGGVGKTDWLYMFALGELTTERSELRIPLLLELSRWPRNWDFPKWVEHHLTRLFPALRARSGRRSNSGSGLIPALLRSNRFVLLLDGFDEVAPARRGELLTALNEDLWLGQAVIMTTRPEAYTKSTGRLRNAATLAIHPLSKDEIVGWLAEVFRSETEFARWQSVIRALRSGENPVSSVLTTPLMVTIAAKVFEAPDSDPAVLADTAKYPDQESITRYLISRFIPVVYSKRTPRSRWSVTQVRGWLEFLATRSAREDRGIAWWRMYAFVPRWLFAVLFGSALGVSTAILVAFTAGPIVGGVPTEPAAYTTHDFFMAPHLVFQSWVENVVRRLSFGAAPSAVVTSTTLGSALGALTASWTCMQILSYRDVCWWRRDNWGQIETGAQSVREVLRDFGYRALSGAVAGAALGLLSGATAGLVAGFGENTNTTFLLAVRVGVQVGAVVGAFVGAFGGFDVGSPSIRGHRGPHAPTVVAVRSALPQPRKIVVAAGLGFALAGGLALAVGRYPGIIGIVGGALGIALLLFSAADDITESDVSVSADRWEANQAERSRVVLRADVLGSVIRILAAGVLVLPLAVPATPFTGSRTAAIASGVFLLFIVVRELAVRPWSWWLVAVVALAVRRRLPWRVLAFLEDARQRQVLIRDGGEYRFRHAALLSQLAPMPTPPARTKADDAEPSPVYAPPEGELLDRIIMARKLHAQGEAAQAVQALDSVVAEIATTGDQRFLLFARSARAHLSGEAGHRLHALVILNHILWIQHRRYGRHASDTIWTQANIASLLDFRLTRWLAELYLESAVHALPKNMDQRSSFVVKLRYQYANLLEKRGSDPVELSIQLTWLHRMLSADHLQRKTILKRMFRADLTVVVEFGGSDPEHQFELLTELLGKARSSLGDADLTIFIIRKELAKVLGRTNRWAEAEEHYLALQEWSKRHLSQHGKYAALISKRLRDAQRRRLY